MASGGDEISEEFSDDEVEMTAADVLQKIEEAWLNEKFSPDLLESKSELIDCMLEQTQEMESNVSKCKKGDFRIIVHKMEIDRIRYILSSYLRIRLQKIEQFYHTILKREAERKDEEAARLSPEEFAFAKEFAENSETHYKNVALRHMPANLQILQQDKTAPKPNLNSYVFLRANQKQEQVLIEPELEDDQNAEVIDLEEGAQYIMRYQPITSLITDGAVSLI
ncbi:DNA replication complex GINS protein SLD5-like [Asterias rubens]|uniref:DNA replication complex GINS protein SLD5-like n=1 Tax=Asterias rubens TaxID=7604 RepID=UPI00145504A9|nr:DNA replication complex GINS protein SLD5-like [Asterias rubens]